MSKQSICHRYEPWFYGTLAAVGVMLLLMLDDNMNRAFFLWANSLSAGDGDAFWSVVTVMGDTLIVFCLLLPAINVRPDLIWSVMIAAIISSLVVHGLKEVIDVPRPPGVFERSDIHLIGYVAGSASFPSGHTTAIFTLLGAVYILLTDYRIRGLLLAIALLAGLSRMVVGIHWPLDVASGALFGLLSGYAGVFVARRTPWGNSPTAQRIQAGIVIVAAILTIGFHDGGYPQARNFMILLPLVLLLLSSRNIWRLFTGIPEKCQQ